jgi:hypothetical protein
MSFSEADMEALGLQLNLMNESLASMSNDIRIMRNILIVFWLSSIFATVGTVLKFY